MIVGFGLFA
jgi:transcriptional regulator with XRE-family HTH domain